MDQLEHIFPSCFSDYQYNGYYINSVDSENYQTARGFNYHQGPVSYIKLYMKSIVKPSLASIPLTQNMGMRLDTGLHPREDTSS